MRGLATVVMITACLGLAGCGGGDDGSGGSGASESMSTSMAETTGASTSAPLTGTEGETETETATATPTGTGGATESPTGTGDDPASAGLPEGVSTWAGQGVINNRDFEFDVQITNSGGDLTATVKIKDELLGNPVFALSGTHEPTAGRIALAPDDWIVPPDLNIELIGLEGVHEAGTITGMLVDFAQGTENFLLGGPFTLTLVDGPGAATIRGDESKSLVVGTQKFSGQVQCTGPIRETGGELVYDGAGGITGTVTIGDPGLDTPIGTFALTGVHNPSTGGVTLVPGLWLDDQGTVLTFYVDGTYNPGTGSFTGDVGTHTAACPPGTWKTTIE